MSFLFVLFSNFSFRFPKPLSIVSYEEILIFEINCSFFFQELMTNFFCRAALFFKSEVIPSHWKISQYLCNWLRHDEHDRLLLLRKVQNISGLRTFFLFFKATAFEAISFIYLESQQNSSKLNLLTRYFHLLFLSIELIQRRIP